MKRSLASILFISLTGITLLGFLAMEAEGGDGCLAVIAAGGVCMSDNSPLAIANFHLNFLKSFSLAIFASLLVLAVAFIWFKISVGFLDKDIFSAVAARIFNICDGFVSFSKRQFMRWLAIHENSPGFAFN